MINSRRTPVLARRGLSVAATLLMTLLVAASTGAQETKVLTADRMLDIETGRIVTDAVVVIEGERIARVGGSVPSGVEVIELGDVTLMPGFMDMHTHLSFDLGGDWVIRSVTETSADEALRGARNAGITLMAGFTTVRNLGSGGFVGVSLRKAVEAGLIEGPRIVPASHSLSITGGHCDVTGWRPGVLETGPEEGVADGPEQVLRAVRYQIKHGAQVIKICATAGVLSFEGPVGAQQFTFEEMSTIVQEAARHGLKVAAHAHGTEGIIVASRAGVASVEHGSILTDEAIETLKANGTYLVPTTYLAGVIDMEVLPPPIRAKAEYVLPLAQESLEQAIRAGVKIAFGTDAAVFPHGDNAREFAALVDRGMSPLEALRAATIYAADLLGVEDRGRIEPELLADLVAVPGNPLEDITVTEEVAFVMIGGRVAKRSHP